MERPPKDELEDACARWGWDGAAEEYEVDRATIVRWLREVDMLGESTRGRKRKPKPAPKRRRIDDDEAAMLYMQHRSTRVVARIMGYDQKAVCKALERKGVEATGPMPPSVSAWTPWLSSAHLGALLDASPRQVERVARRGAKMRRCIEVEREHATGPGNTRWHYRARVVS